MSALATAMAYGAHTGSRRRMSDVYAVPMVVEVMLIRLPSRPRCRRARLARSCGTRPELAAAVDDRSSAHVHHQGDAEQHESRRDQRAATDGVRLAEVVGDVRGDRVAAIAKQVGRDGERRTERQR